MITYPWLTNRHSTTDTEFSFPLDEAQAEHTIAVAWDQARSEPSPPLTSSPSGSGEHDNGGTAREFVEIRLWRLFENILFNHATGQGQMANARPASATESTSEGESHRMTGAPGASDDRRIRYARLLERLDEWANDPTGFDARVAPLMEEALKETAPRHFRE